MNWRRGFIRIATIAYAIWLIFVGWQAYQGLVLPAQVAAEIAAKEKTDQDACVANYQSSEDAVRNCIRIAGPQVDEPAGPTVWPYLGLAGAPPLILLIVWLGANWVRRGFAATP
jgi:hypothetical protein